MKLHPNVHIAETPVTDNTKILAAIAGGSPPDVIDLGLGITVPEWAQRGVLLPLDDYIARSHLDRNQFIASSWLPVIYNGKTYGLPFSNFNVGLVWNRKLFSQAGLDPNRAPSTLEELTTYAAKLTHKSAGKITQLGFLPDYPGNANFQVVTLQNLGWLFGGDWYNAKTHRITADALANVRALSWEVSIYKRFGVQAMANFEQSAGSYLTAQDPFESGKLAMLYDGEWQFGLVPLNGQTTFLKEMDAAPFPAPAGLSSRTGASYIDTNPQVIPMGAKHPDAAWDFIRWEATDLWACGYWNTLGGLAQIKNCDSYPLLRDPRFQVFLRESTGPNAHVWPRVPVSEMHETKLGAVGAGCQVRRVPG